MKFNELGRSMVEMLGVLAIIGVLSVGAIAGYSKAMTKYKLNKQAEQYSQLIAATISVLSSNSISSLGGDHVSKILEKMNMVPQSLIEDKWYDAMGNSIERFNAGTQAYYIHYTGQKAGGYVDSNSITSCVNIFEIIKNYASESSLYSVGIFGGYSITMYSDRYCTKNAKCLSQYSTKDFWNMCQQAYDIYHNGTGTEFVQTIVFK